jgi:hypothetical protein
MGLSMRRIMTLPAAFGRYDDMHGVLDIAVFEDASGTEAETLAAIAQVLQLKHTFNLEKLQSLGRRRIREQVFFGDWYDLKSGTLLKVGHHRTAEGSELQNPALKTLDNVELVGGAVKIPDPGAGGQFAYAFSAPPYSLQGRPSEVQAVFEEIRDFILPPTHASEIYDWSSPQLPEVSDYFIAGLDWWGVFLFSIHVPDLGRLSVIAGSTSD